MDIHTHSVILDKDECIGCTNCIKKCPTEAIRVKDGKAKIIKNRCIDCGECIRICPQRAKKSISDPISCIHNYKYKIALPAPTLLAQFDNTVTPRQILGALKLIGFDHVYEVSRGADVVSNFTREYIKNANITPLISSSCPAIVRLIRIRFPSLIDNLIPIESPMEVAAKLARQKAKEETGLSDEDIGVFFISPCPAKVSAVKNPLGLLKSNVNNVISIENIYPLIKEKLDEVSDDIPEFYDSGKAIGWARSGGETFSLNIENYLCVDGIDHVIKVLDAIENENLKDIDFVECLACVNGCVGGPLTVENPFIARNKIRKISNEYDVQKEIKLKQRVDEFLYSKEIVPENVRKLDDNILKAMKKMEQIDMIYKLLPNLDCGACGSPSCRALAEDIVLGYSDLDDCMVLFRDKVNCFLKKHHMVLNGEDNSAEDEEFKNSGYE
ncbi:MAG: 4Fe-4S dicluster domain-containing protein [Anaeromicrobium sp.]|jgi:iron only hydrogenase large subunit-like protein|uniref:[Fe-Fe] hydrogenase large subunit C-terminal domain-containing protein n=1 Tax=Anaeromicrobium sp. TaxID=1929132 RepID=UPI0025E4B3CB|nr:[Fe-Fe] hydrogenase large subunit C-terminal domain-containing protein [Anaeromicrobium sp.]MCT4595474.1 4Fe-4S dicluster domain-containing protein [Anaeromicrobium sp.]